MERRQLDDHSADLHRLKYGVRIERPGPPDVDSDVQQSRLTDVGRKFPGDCPARLAPSDHTQLVLKPQ